jgi:hypothetical protein
VEWIFQISPAAPVIKLLGKASPRVRNNLSTKISQPNNVVMIMW